MSVNSVGPNVGGSSLLTSYIERQASNSAPQQPFVQNNVQNGVQNSSYNAPKAPLQTFPAQTAFPQNFPQNFPQSPAAQLPVTQPSGLGQASVLLPSTQNSAAQSPITQPSSPQPSVPQAPVAQTLSEIEEPKTDENKAQTPEDKVKTPGGEEKKPSVFSKAKALFKDPKTKKIIIAGIGAAIVIAGITTFALLSRRRAEVSPELENALWDFVNTLNGFFGRR